MSAWVDYTINNNHRLTAGLTLTPVSLDHYQKSILVSGNESHREESLNLDRSHQPASLQDTKGILQYHGTVDGWHINAEAGVSHNGYRVDHTVERQHYRLEDYRKHRATYGWGGGGAWRRFMQSRLMLSFFDYAIGGSYEMDNAVDGKRLSRESLFRNRVGVNATYSTSPSWSVGLGAGINSVRNSWDSHTSTHHTPRLQANAMWSSPKVMIRFNYTASTDFAPLSQLQSFGTYTDSLIYQTGNPSLKPMLDHKFYLMVNLFRDLTLSGEYTIGSNRVFNIGEAAFDPAPYAFFKYQNGHWNSWKINATYTKMIADWTVSASVSFEGQKARYGIYSRSKTNPDYNWYVRYNCKPLDLELYLSSSLHSTIYVAPQQTGWERTDGYMLSFQKYFLDSRLMVFGTWSIPFHLFKDEYKSTLVTPAYTCSEVLGNYRQSDNCFSIGVQFKFHGGQKTQKFSRATEHVKL